LCFSKEPLSENLGISGINCMTKLVAFVKEKALGNKHMSKGQVEAV
jgi:hypothetical protein